MAGVFAGVKVLELGAGAAGPVATRYLADQGAVVVRIESSRRPDFLRLLHMARPTREGLDAAPMFVLMNPNKRSVAIDLTKPEGVALVRRLAGWADVLSENFSPKAMAKWGLDAASLCAENPRLVMVSSCLFGQTGPQRLYPGFGGQGAALAGFNHMTGWPDRPGPGPYGTITDSLSPRYVAFLIAAALLQRERTGRGQSIDVSQIETGVYSLSEMIVRASAGAGVMARRGNASEAVAPHGVYPCRGDDRWLALAVRSDAEWRLLRRAMGNPPFGQDPRFATNAGRLAQREELDGYLARFTAEHEAPALMEALRREGLEVGVVQRLDDLQDDPQLAHREHFVTLSHRALGDVRCEHSGIRLSDAPPRLARVAPDLGADTDHVLRDLLGLDEAELAALHAAEVLV